MAKVTDTFYHKLEETQGTSNYLLQAVFGCLFANIKVFFSERKRKQKNKERKKSGEKH